MDDETYGKADFNELFGQQFYSQLKGCDVNTKFKTIKLDKFAKNIWFGKQFELAVFVARSL